MTRNGINRQLVKGMELTLETGGKVIHVIKWQRTWLNVFSVLWKVELMSN